jgi:type I restriction-modification system DNA methylase subunit
MNPKDMIAQKVEDFAKNEKVYKSKDFQETEARNRFIDPLFEALGWNLNQTNIPKKLWDVHREYSQKDNSSTKKPDYAFRVNAKLKFFVEAKAPHVPLTDKDPVFQAKRYAYSTSGKAPIVILTDFEEFRVFNALQKPNYDNPLQGVLKEFDFRYTDYLDKWDLLMETFSREAVANGSLEKLRGKISKSTKKLDEEFLDEMVAWRENLAKHIAIKNESLTADELNEAVQRILDRLIFIRQLEDRNIVDENTLLGFAKKENLYKEILPLFGELNGKYNGLLFKPHFSEKLIIEDKVLKETILDLCYPRSPFQFDVIEPEILGRIYERFLGSKIRLTENHRAKVEEKDEVRHAGGVYYTPEYIVNYIVKETVGAIVSTMTPEEISKIKILDPSCGSGSFLLGAYQYLLNWHVDYYKSKVLVHKPEANGIDSSKKKNSIPTKFKEDFFFDADGEIKLTTKKKGEILVNNIFGVDIDREATEVAILSLYLKLLEDGIDDDGLLFLKGKVLPDMTNNIKCGNSLITREDLFSNNMFGTTNIKAFDWMKEFPFGGFDCVIGNPPYIRIQELQKWAKDEVGLYKKIYKSGAKGNFDIYILFIEKGLSLLNENGLLGMILPNKFFMADYGELIRSIIRKNVYQIVDFKDNQIFENATTYTNLLFLSGKSTDTFKYANFKSLDKTEQTFETLSNNQTYKDEFLEVGEIKTETLTEKEWNFAFGEDKEFFEKLLKIKTTLNDVSDKLLVGLQTSADPVYILEFREDQGKYKILYSKSLSKEVKLESELLKPLLKGKEIRRYSSPEVENYVIFPYSIKSGKAEIIEKKILEEKYPRIWEYFTSNKERMINRDISGDAKIWWQFGRNQNIIEMSQPKLITQVLASKASYTADLEGQYYFVGGGNAGGYGVKLKPEYEKYYHYVLGLLNSTPIDRYLRHISTQFRGGFYSYGKRFIEKLPIYIPDASDKEKFPLTQKIEEFVKQILELRKNGKTADAEFLEHKIDEMVEKLYGV